MRTALITGVSRRTGIGAGIARRLAADGYALLLHGWAPHDAEEGRVDADGASALAAELTSTGALVEVTTGDFADPAEPARVVSQATSRLGSLDVLVACHAQSADGALPDLTADLLDRTFAVNTRSTLLLAKEFAASRPARAGGRIVWFTSGQYHGAMPGELPYIASKAALHQLTASVAVQLAPAGITVNCIDPGPTETGWADAETTASVAADHPSGRWSTPADTARLVSWLVGDDAGWVTGQVIATDGGWAIRHS